MGKVTVAELSKTLEGMFKDVLERQEEPPPGWDAIRRVTEELKRCPMVQLDETYSDCPSCGHQHEGYRSYDTPTKCEGCEGYDRGYSDGLRDGGGRDAS